MMHPHMGEGPHRPASSRSFTHQTVTVSVTAFCWPFYQKKHVLWSRFPELGDWGPGPPAQVPSAPRAFSSSL